MSSTTVWKIGDQVKVNAQIVKGTLMAIDTPRPGMMKVQGKNGNIYTINSDSLEKVPLMTPDDEFIEAQKKILFENKLRLMEARIIIRLFMSRPRGNELNDAIDFARRWLEEGVKSEYT